MDLAGPSAHPKSSTQPQTQNRETSAPESRQPTLHRRSPHHIRDLRDVLNKKRENNEMQGNPQMHRDNLRNTRPSSNDEERGRFYIPRTPYGNNYKGPPHKYDPNFNRDNRGGPRQFRGTRRGFGRGLRRGMGRGLGRGIRRGMGRGQHPYLDPVNISITYNVEEDVRTFVASNVKLDKNWRLQQPHVEENWDDDKDAAELEFPKIRRPRSAPTEAASNSNISEQPAAPELEVEATFRRQRNTGPSRGMFKKGPSKEEHSFKVEHPKTVKENSAPSRKHREHPKKLNSNILEEQNVGPLKVDDTPKSKTEDNETSLKNEVDPTTTTSNKFEGPKKNVEPISEAPLKVEDTSKPKMEENDTSLKNESNPLTNSLKDPTKKIGPKIEAPLKVEDAPKLKTEENEELNTNPSKDSKKNDEPISEAPLKVEDTPKPKMEENVTSLKNESNPLTKSLNDPTKKIGPKIEAPLKVEDAPKSKTEENEELNTNPSNDSKKNVGLKIEDAPISKSGENETSLKIKGNNEFKAPLKEEDETRTTPKADDLKTTTSSEIEEHKINTINDPLKEEDTPKENEATANPKLPTTINKEETDKKENAVSTIEAPLKAAVQQKIEPLLTKEEI